MYSTHTHTHTHTHRGKFNIPSQEVVAESKQRAELTIAQLSTLTPKHRKLQNTTWLGSHTKSTFCGPELFYAPSSLQKTKTALFYAFFSFFFVGFVQPQQNTTSRQHWEKGEWGCRQGRLPLQWEQTVPACCAVPVPWPGSFPGYQQCRAGKTPVQSSLHGQLSIGERQERETWLALTILACIRNEGNPLGRSDRCSTAVCFRMRILFLHPLPPPPTPATPSLFLGSNLTKGITCNFQLFLSREKNKC